MSDKIAALPPLREVIKAWQLDADKRLGQHFLLDLNLTAKIVRIAGDLTGITAIEIGPGPGGLTRPLAESAAARVIAVERDPRCVAALQAVVEASDGRLTVIHGDALEIDPVALAPSPRAIVANLPYNVATPLLIGWLKQAGEFASMTLMFQREVALRLVASPRSKDYGRLSVMTQWLTEATLVFDLPAAAFTPPPKVVSSVVRLVPRAMGPDEPRFSAMERVVAAAFAQRRKMLRAGLRSFTPDPIALLEAAGIDPTARAEELSIDEFRKLALTWGKGER
ncbi:MAG TPA: 16S rRNA (adenine(1518)-N(6)/adenine(1519)-N(6))-dimethyltransferase RsmA [Alphaproteobacteria bacterium]|jgi:16S rRNA (adenine1518-N6/adenine1519-N6)-dimethyltransferase|nr:16S rRNA (adenine(1518)-N(6)/adenine(1519)-N(6))-dimethyltransferase RsmA [Alphaproteobacteria bacterium]